MKVNKELIIILAIAIIAALCGSALGAWYVSSHPPSPTVTAGVEAAKEFGETIKVQREIIYVKDGEIHEQKEIEIRALDSDQLVGRHLAALYRFSGVSPDREGSGGVDGN